MDQPRVAPQLEVSLVSSSLTQQTSAWLGTYSWLPGERFGGRDPPGAWAWQSSRGKYHGAAGGSDVAHRLGRRE